MHFCQDELLALTAMVELSEGKKQMYNTEEEVWDAWRTYVLPMLQYEYEKDGIKDIPARDESFNNFTDSLLKEGFITQEQYDTFGHPPENEYD